MKSPSAYTHMVSQVTQVDDDVTQRIYTYGYSQVTQVDDEVTQCICMYGYRRLHR